MDFSSNSIVYVTGKGGVGKSATAAGIALREAKKGRRTLLVEFGDHSFYGPLFGFPELGQHGVNLTENLDLARWGRDECIHEYVIHYLKVESLYKIFFQNKMTRTFLNAAPTISELALLGKLTSAIRQVGPPLAYDVIVADGFATGHSLSLIRAPKGIAEAVPVGPLGENAASIFNVMTNPKHCAYVVVALAETLPTVEATELFNTFKSEFKVEPLIVCNRLLTPPVTESEVEALAVKAGEVRDGFPGFLRYLDFSLKKQQKHLRELTKLRNEVYGVPLILQSQKSLDMMTEISGHLERPWTVS